MIRFPANFAAPRPRKISDALHWALKPKNNQELSKENWREPSIWFAWKNQDFLVTLEQKLGAMGHRALLEQSPEKQSAWWPSFFKESGY